MQKKLGFIPKITKRSYIYIDDKITDNDIPFFFFLTIRAMLKIFSRLARTVSKEITLIG
jgi:hypothetical protein